MIWLPGVYGLRLVEIFDRGIANKECMAFHADAPLDMGHYGVMLGWLQGPNHAVPMHDFFFYFGDGKVRQGDWIFVYTGAGEPRMQPQENGVNQIFSVYWGRGKTLFANSNVVPILFQIGGIQLGQAPRDQRQLGLLEQSKLPTL